MAQSSHLAKSRNAPDLAIYPRVAVGEARTMNEIVANALRQQRTSAALISTFAIGALLLRPVIEPARVRAPV